MLHLLLALTAALAGPAAPATVIGHSAEGRTIIAVDRGDPAERPVMVVGCIHGNECAGMAVVRRLRRRPLPPHTRLLLIGCLDPDGRAGAGRLNGRGVDLNRNFPAGWRLRGRPWSVEYSGPRPLSEPETRAAASLIRRTDPTVTVWFHQHMGLVWAWGPSRAAGAAYARIAGMRFAPLPWLAGTAPHWQNATLHRRAFVVELPAGPMPEPAVHRHVRAVLRLARRMGGATGSAPLFRRRPRIRAWRFRCSCSPTFWAVCRPATCWCGGRPAATFVRPIRAAPALATPVGWPDAESLRR